MKNVSGHVATVIRTMMGILFVMTFTANALSDSSLAAEVLKVQGKAQCINVSYAPILVAQIKDCSQIRDCPQVCMCHYENCGNSCKDGDVGCVNRCIKSLNECKDSCR